PQAPQPFALVVTGDMPSNRGDLEGTVYVAGGAPGDDPIAGASVSAINAGGQLARMATSDDDGFYSMSLAMGTYTVTAMAFGYQPAEIGAAEVVSGQVTALDIPLSSATWYTVSGVVRDAATGWPLYAHIAVSSDPLTPPAPYNSVWTDPATGYYSLSLPEGITYTLTATAWVDGYLPGNAVVPPLTGNVTQDIELDADMEACSAPGYEIPYIHLDDFESDDGGYTVSGVPADHWQWGSPVTWPGSCAAGVHCWGTNLTGNYANNAAAVLTSPVIDLSTASAPLAANWRQAWHLESATWDHGYAEISINGGPWQVMWQHTGGTIQVDWTKMSYDISAAAGGSVQFRFRLTSDSSLNYAGYYIDLVNITGAEGCQIPLDGGLIVGNVYDANYPAEALNGADIVNAAGYAAESLPTPLDDAVDDGFYTVFAPAGTQTFTATAMAYSASVVDVTVVDGDTVTQDFFLPTGLLSAAPDGLDVTVELGYADTRTLNLTNAGGAAATFAFEEHAGPVNPLAITGLEEEKQLAAPTGSSTDVPWLAEDPITGTVPAAGDMDVTVAFDAAYVDQPGEYHAELVVTNDTPYGEVRVPVTMTVTGPASWAKLTGTVIGLGVCDDDPAPLGAAEVHVESATTGQTWLVTTDISGTYHLWMDQAHSPVTITVTAPDYFGETGGVLVVQGETTVVDFDLRLLKPCLSYDPADFHVTLPMGDNTVELLTLSNSGAALAEFELMEVIGGFTPLNLKVNISFPRSDAPLSFERAPLPEESGKPFINPNVALQVGAPAYGVDLLGDQFVYFTMDDATNPTNIATATRNYYAGDFINGDFSTLYAIDNATQMLYAIDTASGAQTAVGASVPQSGHTWTGMAGDPTTGVMYACSTDGATNALYILNLASGAPTLVGTHGGGFVLIDIAISSTGQMYGVDINTDQLVAIDKASGVITAIGSLGFDASYAQGMDFDEASGTLYLAAYNAALSRAELRIADTSTGATVLVSTIGAGSGVELDAFAIATTGSAGSAIPWLTETPISSTIAADTDAVVDLTFDAGVPETMQPGTYYGQLKVAGNAANDVPNVPLTLTVEAPATWGKLVGEVTGLGYCDAVTPTLLAGAEILIESGTGLLAWLLETDENGAYQLWLDAAHNPLTVTVAYPDHVPQVFSNVVVVAGATTVRDAALRWAMPCLTVEPDLFDVTVTLGMSTT
ncbi:MAG: carboxypeptidase regulatory-like domain-containing protein, partial [Anaerolineae bacterium]|nr:carboxypeptidase regulatory-like domain-containing protein [Anaerolineae bacterium]